MCRVRYRLTAPQCSTRHPRPRTARVRRRCPLCRTTRSLGAPRGPRARPARPARLILLAAWLTAALAERACPAPPRACPACRHRDTAREHSLLLIKESLLAKMGFAAAPNTTGRELPRVPQEFLERYERKLTPPPPPAGLQSDAPARSFLTHTEEDDFLVRTDDVVVFARQYSLP